jgi:exoribonuclease R
VGPTLSKVGLVEEMTERYWVLRYLEKRPGTTTKGVILDRFPNRYLVHLSEYLLEVDMPVVSGRGFEPGDQLLIRIEKAHARSGTLKIAPV